MSELTAKDSKTAEYSNDPDHIAEEKKARRRIYNENYYQKNYQEKRLKQIEYSRKWRAKNNRPPLPGGIKNSKWNIEAAKSIAKYHVETRNQATFLGKAIQRRGFYAIVRKSNKGYMVLKLRLVNE